MGQNRLKVKLFISSEKYFQYGYITSVFYSFTSFVNPVIEYFYYVLAYLLPIILSCV